MKKPKLLMKMIGLKLNQLGAPQKVKLHYSCSLVILQKDLFYLLPGKAERYNLNRDEWKAMRHLAKDRSITIKPADKGSCVVVCDHLAEVEN